MKLGQNSLMEDMTGIRPYDLESVVYLTKNKRLKERNKKIKTIKINFF